MASVVNLAEYEELARGKIPKMYYDYCAGGAEDGWTLKENRIAYSRIRIRQQVLVDVGEMDLGTSVLGFKTSSPIMVAPTGLHKLAHPQGEMATARAAAAEETIMVLSTAASMSIEEVAEAGPGTRFFQLYVYNMSNAIQLVKRAENYGYKAIVLTVDTPVVGRREADLRNRFHLPPGVNVKNFDALGEQHSEPESNDSALAASVDKYKDKSITWKDVKVLMESTKLPFLLKGILTKEATVKALELGVAGVIVSNHGGRQLDHVPATISVLEEVVAAAAGRIPVFIDGGIRRGTDIFKALALGASGVLIGRPILFGLAVDGEQGVRKVLQMLRDELRTTMMLAGCPKLKHITRSSVQTEEQNKAHSRM